jgi:HD-GYP domain-containing protein (c-di-GMP phosphodiesterase class II)
MNPMRADLRARAVLVGTVGLGAAVLGVAFFARSDVPLTLLALIAAAALVTEFVQVEADETSPAPGDAHSFSFSSGVHVATILVVGPWTAALVAAGAVIVVDRLRSAPWRHVAFNASVFALAAVSAGFAFEAAGGARGGVTLPTDFLALGALGLTYYSVNTALTCGIVAANARSPFLPLAQGSYVDGASSFAAEAGLGVAFAFLATHEPWALVVLIPLLVAVFRSHERLAALRRETMHALETFANVVDRRDPYTFAHSARVADYVHGLAQRLGLPLADVERLRWAGRLHDLGKIAVDTSVLRNPGRLAGEDWAALRRHPRLSAHLLRRFRFAGSEARAIELHHERFDGGGYYGVAGDRVPAASHFLIVADSFDAMTTDRPYRAGLTKEQALTEIETNAGTQFHPAIARAFVAWQRGGDPLSVLTGEERQELRSLWTSGGRTGATEPRRRRPEHDVATIAALTAGLVLFAAGFALALPLAATAAGGLFVFRAYGRAQRARTLAALQAPLDVPGLRQRRLEAFADALSALAPLRWAGLVSWDERELAGAIEVGWSGGGGSAPTEHALTSWIAREAEVGAILLDREGSLGPNRVDVALPLGEAPEVAGYLVLTFDRSVEARVLDALRAGAASISSALAPLGVAGVPPARLTAVR